MKIEGKMEKMPFKWDGEINVEYGRQSFVFDGKIADESTSENSRYIAQAMAKHDASMFDFDFKSEIENTRENVGGNMQVKYLAASDRQVKNLGLRAEINKLRNELNFEVSAKTNIRVFS